MSGLFSRIFGGSSESGKKTETAQTTQDAIQQLRNVEDILNKKIGHLESEINEATATARRLAQIDKRNAINALKRKKRLEKTLQQVDGTLITLECQREALQNAAMNGEAFGALRTAANALKKVHEDLGVENIEDILDDLRGQQEVSQQIADLLSNPIGFGAQFDQSELEDELQKLGQEARVDETPRIVNLPSVPVHDQIEEDDLRALEELAS